MSLTAKKACEIFFEAAADTSWPRGDNWLDVASSSSDIKGSAFAKVFHLVLKSGRDISAQGGEMGVVLLCDGVENISIGAVREQHSMFMQQRGQKTHTCCASPWSFKFIHAKNAVMLAGRSTWTCL